MSTDGIIEYYVNVHEDLEVSMTDAKASATFYIPWSDRVDYITNVLGGPVDDGDGNVTIQPGQQHPDYPILYVQSADVKPFGDYDSVNATWLNAEVTLHYALNPFPDNSLLVNTTSKQHLDVTYTTSLDGIVLDATTLFVYKSGSSGTVNPLTNDVSPQHWTPIGKMLIRMPFEPAIDPTQWQQYQGFVNNDDFMGWGPQRVLFTNAETTRQISIVAGADTWQIDLEFLVKAENDPNCHWNAMYVPRAQALGDSTQVGYGWFQLSSASAIYSQASFNDLINGFPV
jgi:hypothetical protein